jgi:hypothetical protein
LNSGRSQLIAISCRLRDELTTETLQPGWSCPNVIGLLNCSAVIQDFETVG